MTKLFMRVCFLCHVDGTLAFAEYRYRVESGIYDICPKCKDKVKQNGITDICKIPESEFFEITIDETGLEKND